TAAEIEAGLQQDLREQKMDLKDFEIRVRKENRMSLYEWKEDVIRARLLAAKLCRDRVKAEEDEIRKAYEAHYGEKVECRIIIWPKDEEKRVMMLYPKIRDSEAEFDRAAHAQASPTLAQSGGKITPIGRYSTGNEEMEKVAFSLKPGEISHVM